MEMLRQRLSPRAKIAIRSALARAGLEIGGYTGSLAEHRARLLESMSVATVWDLGAHVGQYAVRLRDGGFAGRIISVEPNPRAFSELSRRAAREQHWVPVAVAVSDEPGTCLLNVSEDEQSSSLLAVADRHVKAHKANRVVRTEIVEATTLDALYARYTPPEPYFLKLDLQGGEAAALRRAASILRRTAACEVELSLTELYRGQGTWQTVVGMLEGAGLAMCDLERVCFDPASQDLLQVNALFRRVRQPSSRA